MKAARLTDQIHTDRVSTRTREGDPSCLTVASPKSMTPADFADWIAAMRATRGWLQKDCALALGVQPRQIGRWRDSGAPPYVALACAAIAAGLPTRHPNPSTPTNSPPPTPARTRPPAPA
jgi:ribosome-binding protein aMBF1 (putative translation factor)